MKWLRRRRAALPPNSRVDTDLGGIIQSLDWPCTVAGWIWYCDEHDTHGNANTEPEATAVSETHASFYDECDLYVTKVEP